MVLMSANFGGFFFVINFSAVLKKWHITIYVFSELHFDLNVLLLHFWEIQVMEQIEDEWRKLRMNCSHIAASLGPHCSLIGASLQPHWSLIAVSLQLHCSFIAASLQLHCSFIAASLGPNCSLIGA